MTVSIGVVILTVIEAAQDQMCGRVFGVNFEDFEELLFGIMDLAVFQRHAGQFVARGDLGGIALRVGRGNESQQKDKGEIQTGVHGDIRKEYSEWMLKVKGVSERCQACERGKKILDIGRKWNAYYL